MSNRRRLSGSAPPAPPSRYPALSQSLTLPRIVLIKVKDGLFLGNRDAALQAPFVFANKVGVIINCAGNQVLNRFEMNGIRYLTFYWKDMDTTVILDSKDKAIDEVVEAIDEVHNQGLSCLIVSFRGQKTAYEYMLAKQPDMIIKPAQMRQLKALEDRMKKSGSSLLTFDHPFDMSSEDPEGFIVRMTYVNCKLAEPGSSAPPTPTRRESQRRRLVWADSSGKPLLDQHDFEQDEPLTISDGSKKHSEPHKTAKPILRRAAQPSSTAPSVTRKQPIIMKSEIPALKPSGSDSKISAKAAPNVPGQPESIDNLFVRAKANGRASRSIDSDTNDTSIEEESIDDDSADTGEGASSQGQPIPLSLLERLNLSGSLGQMEAKPKTLAPLNSTVPGASGQNPSMPSSTNMRRSIFDERRSAPESTVSLSTERVGSNHESGSLPRMPSGGNFSSSFTLNQSSTSPSSTPTQQQQAPPTMSLASSLAPLSTSLSSSNVSSSAVGSSSNFGSNSNSNGNSNSNTSANSNAAGSSANTGSGASYSSGQTGSGSTHTPNPSLSVTFPSQGTGSSIPPRRTYGVSPQSSVLSVRPINIVPPASNASRRPQSATNKKPAARPTSSRPRNSFSPGGVGSNSASSNQSPYSFSSRYAITNSSTFK